MHESFYCRIEKSLTAVDLTAEIFREIWRSLLVDVWSNVWWLICLSMQCRAGLCVGRMHIRYPPGGQNKASKRCLTFIIIPDLRDP